MKSLKSLSDLENESDLTDFKEITYITKLNNSTQKKLFQSFHERYPIQIPACDSILSSSPSSSSSSRSPSKSFSSSTISPLSDTESKQTKNSKKHKLNKGELNRICKELNEIRNKLANEHRMIEQKEYVFNPLQAEKELRTGNFYAKKGNFKAASMRYQEATKWNPGMPEAWLKLGEALEKRKDMKGAREAYAKYLELAPDAKNAALVKKKL